MKLAALIACALLAACTVPGTTVRVAPGIHASESTSGSGGSQVGVSLSFYDAAPIETRRPAPEVAGVEPFPDSRRLDSPSASSEQATTAGLAAADTGGRSGPVLPTAPVASACPPVADQGDAKAEDTVEVQTPWGPIQVTSALLNALFLALLGGLGVRHVKKIRGGSE